MNPGSDPSSPGHTAATLAVVLLTVVLVTAVVDRTGPALAIAVLGMYVVHLMGLRRARDREEERWEELVTFIEETVRRETASSGRRAGGGASSGTRVYSPSGGGSDAPAGGGAESGTLWQEEEPRRDVPVPRNFALGTVALIKEKLTPAEIDEVLKVQESRPGEYFGQIAVELGFLESDELEELLETQKEGLFTVREIQDARRRLKAYQRQKKKG